MIVLPSPPCSIACSITAMSSNAVPAVGEPKWTCLTRRQKAKTTLSRTLAPLAGFGVIINARF